MCLPSRCPYGRRTTLEPFVPSFAYIERLSLNSLQCSRPLAQELPESACSSFESIGFGERDSSFQGFIKLGWSYLSDSCTSCSEEK